MQLHVMKLSRTLHYGKHVICRVPNFGHSAKTCFAERRTRQNMTLGKEAFAECLSLGKDLHSAKADTRQRLVGLNSIQRRPLCRVPPVWHSAK